jgi:hypothetical protein
VLYREKLEWYTLEKTLVDDAVLERPSPALLAITPGKEDFGTLTVLCNERSIDVGTDSDMAGEEKARCVTGHAALQFDGGSRTGDVCLPTSTSIIATVRFVQWIAFEDAPCTIWPILRVKLQQTIVY